MEFSKSDLDYILYERHTHLGHKCLLVWTTFRFTDELEAYDLWITGHQNRHRGQIAQIGVTRD
jgi:hypothetical protein